MGQVIFRQVPFVHLAPPILVFGLFFSAAVRNAAPIPGIIGIVLGLVALGIVAIYYRNAIVDLVRDGDLLYGRTFSLFGMGRRFEVPLSGTSGWDFVRVGRQIDVAGGPGRGYSGVRFFANDRTYAMHKLLASRFDKDAIRAIAPNLGREL